MALILAIIGQPEVALCAQANAAWYEVKKEEIWIPMKDGVRLSATVFMPQPRQSGEKFPAVFQYDPYRKDDNCDLGA